MTAPDVCVLSIMLYEFQNGAPPQKYCRERFAAFGGNTVSKSTNFLRHEKFTAGDMNLINVPRSGQPRDVGNHTL